MMTTVERLVADLNTGKLAPAVGVDRAKLLPGPGTRIQVGIRVSPKKAPIYEAVEQVINLCGERNFLTYGLERQTGETFILSLEEKS